MSALRMFGGLILAAYAGLAPNIADAADVLEQLAEKTWIKWNSSTDKSQPEMGSMVRFGKANSGKPLDMASDWAPMVTISSTSGEHGSTHRILGQGVECYYRVTLIDDELLLALKKGDSSCLATSHFKYQPEKRIVTGDRSQAPPSAPAPPVKQRKDPTRVPDSGSRSPSIPMAKGEQPSFDCDEYKGEHHKVICSSSELRRLDREMSSIYNAVIASIAAVSEGSVQLMRAAQSSWLKQRDNCGGDADCLREAYAARQIQLKRIWLHNGSPMQLVLGKSNARKFVYEAPRPGLEEFGIIRGEVLFSGRRADGRYEGEMHLFSKRCGKIAYRAIGTWSSDETEISVKAKRPVLDAQCNHTDYTDETAGFKYMKWQQ